MLIMKDCCKVDWMQLFVHYCHMFIQEDVLLQSQQLDAILWEILRKLFQLSLTALSYKEHHYGMYSR